MFTLKHLEEAMKNLPSEEEQKNNLVNGMVYSLAKFMHEEYQRAAKEYGWNIQESTKVDFIDLPEENIRTMLHVATKILFRYNLIILDEAKPEKV